jgi:hypothetical protein
MYPIIEVPHDAPDDIEAVGSKRKFWFTEERSSSGEEWLFKFARAHTGEDWAEKIAAELCGCLRLPHATYELAVWDESADEPSYRRGVVSRRLDAENERLLLGNELLAGHVNRYPRAEGDRFYRNPNYTLELTLDVLGDDDLDIRLDPEWVLPDGVTTVPEAFLGFLLIDAWIGNTDRHDNNWGIIERSTQKGPVRYLAPTFDHASSLGRELRDQERHERLTTNDKNRTVQAYVQRCRSAFVAEEGSSKTIHPTVAFQRAAELFPDAAEAWLQSLSDVPENSVNDMFRLIPGDRISSHSIDFALRQLNINRNELLSLSC